MSSMFRGFMLALLLSTMLGGCASFEPMSLEQLEQLEYVARATTQERDGVRVTVSVLTRQEARKAFGKKLDKQWIQPVWIEIENNSVDESFDNLGIIPFAAMGETTSGFVFSNLKLGTKQVRVRLMGDRKLLEFEFFVTVPGLRADGQRVDFESLYADDEWVNYDDPAKLQEVLEEFMCCTTRKDGTGSGDPINLVVIGSVTALKGFIKAGWDETEIISAGSSWRTFKSFVAGSEYKYSPISALYVFQRPQDIGLQKARDTINERNHLRLWLSPITFRGEFVWIGAISRDIGVLFTTRAWNLTTHAIDPEVDEARNFLTEDLAIAQALLEIGMLKGVGEVTREQPKKNLLGSPWWTDGRRAVLRLADEPVPLELVELIKWADDF